MKQRGFTLIEMIIAVVIVLIVIRLAMISFNSTENSISYGYNGLTEGRCIDGYKFIVSQDGSARQIMDELGKGVKCQ